MSLPDGAIRITLPDGAEQVLPEETAVALVYDGTTQAVMMATPADLEDFLIGFALTEGLIEAPGELSGIAVLEQPRGIEARGWLAAGAGLRFMERRRAMAGPVGCGLCGIDSLEQALRPLTRAPRAPFGGEEGGAASAGLTPDLAARALDDLRAGQVLKDASRATHAAGFWMPEAGIVALREDVGRHNALDKLVGALARQGIDPARGAVVMTSRVSVDLVQKAAVAGAGALIAPSAPTSLAVREAGAAGLRLIARGAAGLTVFATGA
ncbi:formate dehydrogenase accessory sulfurtransferase FdhD [Paenirhodobacter populi]|uniref:Formate dehydrogenase accessory sulfurtransferase FdhD n=1 Tax=Paenirhodobacter populi TaxID=2306993 RepID=A0A443IRI8_9RHOB|nr:formate dehydrogenase accessory sulfurtransferase FdhD [Sinirhodobacter populi]RWR10015.1 formate dehydrogenase accessory sulfurtransferase FdhD [Sinirhodobacter populi]